MLNDHSASVSMNPVFLRHDLMIELGRLEMAMEDACSPHSNADQDVIQSLQTKHARIAAALSRLPG